MIIGVDLDDVLGDFVGEIIKYYNPIDRTDRLKEEFVHSNFSEFWMCNRDKENERMNTFYKTLFFKNLKTIKGAQEGTKKLAEKNELYIISARPKRLYEDTTKWLERKFWNTFKGIYLTSQAYGEQSDRKKSEICYDIGIDIMIEDNLEHAIDCANKVKKVLLLDYPWNKKEDLPDNIQRIYSWNDIVQEF